MTRLNVKEKSPLGFRRSFLLSRSEKTFVGGILVLFIGLMNAITTLVAISRSHDFLVIRSSQTSPFIILIHALNSSFYFRISLAFCLVGLFVLLIGYLNRRDEKDGNIMLPPRYVKE